MGIETHTTTAGRTRERLPITPSLICELLAALALSLVLADPRWGDVGKVVHLVVVLDNSASMSSHPPGLDEKSFRDAAVEELDRRAKRLPARQRRHVAANRAAAGDARGAGGTVG